MTESGIKELIKRRRNQLLIHSYIYFKLDDSIISNYKYDEWVRELRTLQKEYPFLSQNTELYEEFKDIDSLGFGASLPFEQFSTLDQRARNLLERYHQEQKKI